MKRRGVGVGETRDGIEERDRDRETVIERDRERDRDGERRNRKHSPSTAPVVSYTQLEPCLSWPVS